ALGRFRAAAFAVVHAAPEGESRVLLSGADDALLRRELATLARIVPHAGAGCVAPAQFARCGFAPHIIRAIPSYDGARVLWLGYKRGVPPAEIEQRWADELASEIASRLLLVSTLAGGAAPGFAPGDERRPGSLAQLSHDIRSPLGNIRSVL